MVVISIALQLLDTPKRQPCLSRFLIYNNVMQTPQKIVQSLQYKLSDPSWEERKEDIKQEFDKFKQQFVVAGFYDQVKDQLEEMEQKFK